MSTLSKIGNYIAENARLSFAAWSGGYRVGSLIAAVVALILTGFALATGAIAGVAPSTITGWLTLSGAAWFLFLVLIVTPFRMWDGQGSVIAVRDATIAYLEAKITAKAVTQEKLDRLWALRAQGVKLRNERISADSSLSQWLMRAQDWRIETLEAAREISPNLRARLEVLDQTRPPPEGVNPWTREHERQLRICSEILARLGEYLKGQE